MIILILTQKYNKFKSDHSKSRSDAILILTGYLSVTSHTKIYKIKQKQKLNFKRSITREAVRWQEQSKQLERILELKPQESIWLIRQLVKQHPFLVLEDLKHLQEVLRRLIDTDQAQWH